MVTGRNDRTMLKLSSIVHGSCGVNLSLIFEVVFSLFIRCLFFSVNREDCMILMCLGGIVTPHKQVAGTCVVLFMVCNCYRLYFNSALSSP